MWKESLVKKIETGWKEREVEESLAEICLCAQTSWRVGGPFRRGGEGRREGLLLNFRHSLEEEERKKWEKPAAALLIFSCPGFSPAPPLQCWSLKIP